MLSLLKYFAWSSIHIYPASWWLPFPCLSKTWHAFYSINIYYTIEIKLQAHHIQGSFFLNIPGAPGMSTLPPEPPSPHISIPKLFALTRYPSVCDKWYLTHLPLFSWWWHQGGGWFICMSLIPLLHKMFNEQYTERICEWTGKQTLIILMILLVSISQLTHDFCLFCSNFIGI